MKLERKEQVEVIDVLATYKEKVKQSPFIAILKFAYENNNNITSEDLYKFIGSLSQKACKNILERLTNQGYFEGKEDYNGISYLLTDLGLDSAKKEEFFDHKNGVLRLHIVTNEFVKQKIVKVEKAVKSEHKEASDFTDINKTVLNSLSLSEKITLTNGEFIIEKIDRECDVKKEYETYYVFEVNKNFVELSIEEFKGKLEKTQQDIINHLLNKEFDNDYLKADRILELPLDESDLSLIRNVKIKEPYISNTKFNSIEIKSVKISPKKEELIEWYKALLISKIDNHDYFLEEEDYEKLFNTTINEFHLHKELLKNSVTKENLITSLKKDFYKQVKLTAINYLNY